MAKCYLTERQKNLVRSIVPGLQDGTVKTEWVYVTGDGEIMGIFGLDDDGTLWREVWEGVTESDFDDFCECGFFRHKDGNRYTLSAQMIIEAVNSNFDQATSLQLEKQSQTQLNLIFGEPSNSPQFQCDIFTLMPFASEFLPIYADYIKPIAQSLNLNIKRADDFFSKHEIIYEIWSAIYNSRLVIADCTGKNANVFYELGIAHTLDKPAIMITQSIDDIPFDLRGKRAIVYQYTPPGMKQFEEELKRAIQNVLNDEDNGA